MAISNQGGPVARAPRQANTHASTSAEAAAIAPVATTAASDVHGVTMTPANIDATKMATHQTTSTRHCRRLAAHVAWFRVIRAANSASPSSRSRYETFLETKGCRNITGAIRELVGRDGEGREGDGRGRGQGRRRKGKGGGKSRARTDRKSFGGAAAWTWCRVRGVQSCYRREGNEGKAVTHGTKPKTE